MKRAFLFGVAACALCAHGTAAAQQNTYNSPALLPIPEVGIPGGGYPLQAMNRPWPSQAAPLMIETRPAASDVVPAAPTAPQAAYPTAVSYQTHPQLQAQAAPQAYADPSQQAYAAASEYKDLWTGNPSESASASNSEAYEEAMSSDCSGDCGGTCGACATCCGPRLFASVGALFMTRDRSNPFWTTYETNNNPNQLMNTNDADADWSWGGEVHLGFRCCCAGALEVVYWGLDPMNGTAAIRDVNNNLSTPLDLGFVTIDGQQASDFFDNSRAHSITRSDEVQNVEINFLQWPIMGDYSQRTQVYWLAGVRFFRFRESLIFGAAAGGSEFGDNGGLNEAYLDVHTQNNLIGFQVGAMANYFLTNRFRLYATPKIGIYGNDISQRSQLYRGDGLSAFDIESTKDDVSFLGQLDLGAAWQFAPRWSVYGGYRVVAVTGVALADDQIPPFLADAAGFAEIDSNASLVLSGAMFGLMYNF